MASKLKSSGDSALCEMWPNLGPSVAALNRANNCYAYAVGTLEAILDVRSRGHAEATPQPGDASGIPKSILLLLYNRSLAFWMRLAERDGLRRLDIGPDEPLPKLPPQRRLVALTYSLKAQDYHWLRRESNDLWTCKTDSLRPPTWFDEQRQLISDPRHAALWDYNTGFVFFSLPARGIEVRMRKDWLRFFHALDDAVHGNQTALRVRLRDLANLVRADFAVFADYLEDLAEHGAGPELKAFWKALRHGTRLPNADGLVPFDPAYAHVPPSLFWAVRMKPRRDR